jgi:hypothetical protein
VERIERAESGRRQQVALGVAAFLGGLTLAGAFVSGSVFTNAPFLILALFAVACAPLSVSLGAHVRLSTMHVFVLAAALLAGTPQAVLIAALGALSSLVVARPRPSLPLAVALLSAAPLEALLAGSAFALCGGLPGELAAPASLAAMLFASLAYYFAHTLAAAAFVGIEEGTPIVVIWFDRYAWTLPSFLSAGAAATLIGMVREWAGLHAFVLLVPFALLLFQHYKLRRERDRERALRLSGSGGGKGEKAGSGRGAGSGLDPGLPVLHGGSEGSLAEGLNPLECPPEGVRRRRLRERPRPQPAPPC